MLYTLIVIGISGHRFGAADLGKHKHKIKANTLLGVLATCILIVEKRQSKISMSVGKLYIFCHCHHIGEYVLGNTAGEGKWSQPQIRTLIFCTFSSLRLMYWEQSSGCKSPTRCSFATNERLNTGWIDPQSALRSRLSRNFDGQRC